MKIIRSADLLEKVIREHPSEGARVAHLLGASAGLNVVRVRLAANGVLGMHPANEDQMFVVVGGSGWVQSNDVGTVGVEEGDVVLWLSGERHETKAGADGLTAIVIEGTSLGDALKIGKEEVQQKRGC